MKRTSLILIAILIGAAFTTLWITGNTGSQDHNAADHHGHTHDDNHESQTLQENHEDGGSEHEDHDDGHDETDMHPASTYIDAGVAAASGIETGMAGPAVIFERLRLSGQVQTDPDRVSRVRPRFPGVVRSVRRNLGDRVEKGDILATVQSNESLETYSLKAPIGGLIVRREIQVGEATGDEPLFIIADLSAVWVELDVFGRDISRVLAGQAVEVETFDGYRAAGEVDYVSPLSAHASQSVRARIRLDNPDGRLRPGQFVRGRVTVARHEVSLAVRASALQRSGEHEVVFVKHDDEYEERVIEPGRRDSDWVEVLAGLTAGNEYVAENSYLVKADIEKAGASHDH